jgi:iron(III) transport system substrate-binding protein
MTKIFVSVNKFLLKPCYFLNILAKTVSTKQPKFASQRRNSMPIGICGRRHFMTATLFAAATPHAYAQDITPAAGLQDWKIPKLLAAAQTEGSVTIYSAINEQEALPYWQSFTKQTGIHVNYVRSSDSQIAGRIAIERRAGSHAWDIVSTTTVMLLPPEFLADLDVPEAANIIPNAIGASGKWYGIYANYNTPSYNTQLVSTAQLPVRYEDFLAHPEWAGRIAIDGSDTVWLKGMFARYGEDQATALLHKIVATLKPIVVDGHLALARSVAAGEYIGALNNYAALTLNQQLAGGPTDNMVLDPVVLSFGQVGIDAQAPHPNAARLAINYMLSAPGQAAMSVAGRIPVRRQVPPDLAHAVKRLTSGNVVTVVLSAGEEQTLEAKFQNIFAVA